MPGLKQTQRVFLPLRTKIQPLSCRWPTWPHLLAPAQQAMNVAFRHLPNLRSFIKTPGVHVAASKDPSMLGGPFVSLSEADIGQVHALITRMTTQHGDMVRFAEDFRALNGRLQSNAKGMALDGYYSELPPTLAGLVEMVYDLNSHPEVRVQEELLQVRGLGGAAGEELCLEAIDAVERPFFMSTPVIDGPGKLFLKVYFADPLVETLAALRTTAAPLGEVSEVIRQRGGDTDCVEGLVSANAPERRAPQYVGEGVRLRYFGHACVLLQTSEVAVLLDPLTAWERDTDLASLTFDDLPDRIDFAVITHSHQDHFNPEMLLQLRGRIGQLIVPRNNAGSLADPSMKLILRRLGYRNVTVVDPLDRIELPGGEILVLPFAGEHCGLPVNSKLCALVRLAGRSVAFLVDSDGRDPQMYARIRDSFGPVDALFVGMECHGAPLSWLYGPLLGKAVSRKEDDSRRLSGSDCARAWRLVEEFGAREVYVYAMGQEPWLRSIMGLEYSADSIQLIESDRLIARCREAGIKAHRLKGCREINL